MDTAFDHDPWLRARPDRQEKSCHRAGLDWHGLAGLFAAVHAFHATAVPQHRVDPDAPGSFDAQAARRLAEFAALAVSGQRAQANIWSHAVNLTHSADGKSGSGIGSDVAGPHMSGTRGLK